MASGYHERFKKLIEDIRPNIHTIKTRELFDEMKGDNDIVVVDVRESVDWDMSHIPKALCVPKSVIERDIEYFVPNAGQKIVLYSLEGYLSLVAADNLIKMGYENVYSLKGGYHAWTIAGLPIQEKGERIYPEKKEVRDEIEEASKEEKVEADVSTQNPKTDDRKSEKN